MRPPVRPPQLRCVFFSPMYLPHLLVLPATFWTSVPFATLSVFPSLICGSCPSGQRFAYSFFQIPSHGGHPCCSAMCFVVAYAHLGLSPIRKRPCWANKIRQNTSGDAFAGITATTIFLLLRSQIRTILYQQLCPLFHQAQDIIQYLVEKTYLPVSSRFSIFLTEKK